jgi:hypothetical protein
MLINSTIAVAGEDAVDAPFPDVGCSFTYQFKDSGEYIFTETIVSILENREFKGKEVYAAEVIQDGKRYIHYYDKKTASFIAKGLEGKRPIEYYKPHEGVLKSSMKVGDKWESNFNHHGRNYYQDVEVVREENMYIGGQSYRTLKLEITRRFRKCYRNRKRFIKKAIWYCPELAMVVKFDETKAGKNPSFFKAGGRNLYMTNVNKIVD